MKRALGYLVFCAVFTFVLGEIGVRVLTGVGRNGMPVVRRFPLLPYRPTPEIIRKHRESDSSFTYIVRDAEMGWTITPNGMQPDRQGHPLATSNPQAVRCAPDRFYTAEPPEGVVRIVAVGDSFTHGDDVHNEETWPYYLEQTMANSEVLNLGVPAFGTDQALLRWLYDGRAFNPDIAILGIWPENLCRNLNIFRYYLTPAASYANKPRVVIRDGTPEFINSPVLDSEQLIATLAHPASSALVVDDFWYHPWETRDRFFYASRLLRVGRSLIALYGRKRTRARLYSGADPTAIRITVAIAQEFDRSAKATGAVPIILLIPMQDLLDMHVAPKPFPLVRALRAAGLNVIDLGPTVGRAFLDQGKEAIYSRTRHHTPLANRIIAEQVARDLQPYIRSKASN